MLIGGLPTIIIMAAIAISVLLSIYLPWKRKIPASYVISISIIVVLLLGVFLSSNLFEDILNSNLHTSNFILWLDLAFYPQDMIDDYTVYRFITSMYMHSGFLHAVSNLIGLLFIGTQFEQRIGWKRFLLLYYGTGILASCVVLAVTPFDLLGHDMHTLSIGASGAIFGILGAFFYLYPQAEIFFPLIIVKKWNISLIIFIYMAITSLFIFVGTDDNVSHLAHFAGLGVSFPLAIMVGRPPEEAERKSRPWDFRQLEGLADTADLKRYLNRAKEADEPEIREAWLSELFRKSECPKCKGKGMAYEDRRATCPRCENRIDL